MNIHMRLCYREVVTRDHGRRRSARPMVLIDHKPESRSFHIFYMRPALAFFVAQWPSTLIIDE